MRYCRFTEKLGFPSETLENHLLSCHVHRLTRFRHHITSFWLTWPLFPPRPPPPLSSTRACPYNDVDVPFQPKKKKPEATKNQAVATADHGALAAKTWKR